MSPLSHSQCQTFYPEIQSLPNTLNAKHLHNTVTANTHFNHYQKQSLPTEIATHYQTFHPEISNQHISNSKTFQKLTLTAFNVDSALIMLHLPQFSHRAQFFSIVLQYFSAKNGMFGIRYISLLSKFQTID